MNITCPECKNTIDLSTFTDLAVDQNIECGTCGISLLVTKIEGDSIEVEIADEGK